MLVHDVMQNCQKYHDIELRELPKEIRAQMGIHETSILVPVDDVYVLRYRQSANIGINADCKTSVVFSGTRDEVAFCAAKIRHRLGTALQDFANDFPAI